MINLVIDEKSCRVWLKTAAAPHACSMQVDGNILARPEYADNLMTDRA